MKIKKTNNQLFGNSVPIQNFILDELVKPENMKLTFFLKKELEKIFGKWNQTIRREFLFYIWILEFEGYIFNLFTAQTYGMQIEIVLKDEKENINEVCINFVNELSKILIIKE